MLTGIAAISLSVAGIGIMNIMLVSVTERTREIGIRISVGARRRDIMSQFLIEALALCLLGGVIGLLLGVIMGIALGPGAGGQLPLDITPATLILPFSVSSGVGLIFGLYPGTVQLWQIYLLAILLGLTKCVDLPARWAFVVEMVGREDLPNAVALDSSLSTLARIVGPGLGGIIIAASGVTMLFLFNALSFLPVIVGLVLIKNHELHAQAPQPANASARQKTWHSLREGVDYVWNTPAVLFVILIVGLVLLFGSNFNVLLPLFATDVLQVGAMGFGFLSAAIGLGALISALWLAWSNLKHPIRRALIGMLAFGALDVAFALSHIYLLSLVLIASVGFVETAFAAQATTTLQTVAPDHLRGRVMSVQVLFFDGSVPLGYLLVGSLAGLCGASVALLICALLSLLVAGAGWVWRKRVEQDCAENERAASLSRWDIKLES